MTYITRRQRLAAEVRAEMARQRIALTTLSEKTGIPLSTLRRRTDAHVPFDVDELDAVGRVLGVSVAALLARTEAEPAEVA